METYFRSAIDAGLTERVIELLKLGLPIVVDSDGQTALHLAASAGHLEMVEALIQAGCDVGIQDFVSNALKHHHFYLRRGNLGQLMALKWFVRGKERFTFLGTFVNDYSACLFPPFWPQVCWF